GAFPWILSAVIRERRSEAPEAVCRSIISHHRALPFMLRARSFERPKFQSKSREKLATGNSGLQKAWIAAFSAGSMTSITHGVAQHIGDSEVSFPTTQGRSSPPTW